MSGLARSPAAGKPGSGVALVITCFNHGRFLADAIESGLSQLQPFDEIVVVDDGSTDDSGAVASRFPQVRYVSQANKGLAAARNAGLQLVSAQHVIFLDADDRLTPSAVEAALRCLAIEPDVPFVYGTHRYVDASGAPGRRVALRRINGPAYAAFLRGNPVGMHAAVTYRRAALLEAGGFDESLGACEDYDMYLRLATGRRVASHDTEVAQYRWHGANMSGDAKLMLKAVLGVLDRQEAAVRGEPALEEALREGRRVWKDYYGARLADQMAGRLRSGGAWAAVVRDMFFLLREAPHALASDEFNVWRIMARRLMPRLPRGLRCRVAEAWPGIGYRPGRGEVTFGDLRRLEPISRDFGFDRGQPIDRYYIEGFLSRHADDIRGRVLEVGDRDYTQRFGGDRVEASDVLNVHDRGGVTSIVSDLEAGEGIPDEAFDCLVITQTLHLVFDVPAAIRTIHRILKPGGVLLLTVPGTIGQIDQGQWGDTWYWGFGPRALERLFKRVFPDDFLEFGSHGNVLAGVAFLEGLAAEELRPVELNFQDELYPVLLTVRAIRPGAAPDGRMPDRAPRVQGSP